jgi:hypothetical protein
MAIPHKSAAYPNLAAVVDLPRPSPEQAAPAHEGRRQRRRRSA